MVVEEADLFDMTEFSSEFLTKGLFGLQIHDMGIVKCAYIILTKAVQKQWEQYCSWEYK